MQASMVLSGRGKPVGCDGRLSIFQVQRMAVRFGGVFMQLFDDLIRVDLQDRLALSFRLIDGYIHVEREPL